jgi:hypothetical protein
MSGSIQTAIYKGYAAAAATLGVPHTQCRPGNNPLLGIQSWAPIATNIVAVFDTDPGFSFKAPSKYGKAEWFGLFDATVVQVGDYLISSAPYPPNPWEPNPAIAAPTYFVASLEALHPPLCILCNSIVGLTRTAPSAPGPGYYEGDVAVAETTLADGWPASVLTGTKGEKGVTGLPGDTRNPWIQALLPAMPGVTLQTGDILYDQLGRKYSLSSCELSPLGWRLTGALDDT